MPEVRPINILSFSSEDRNFPASNLLLSDGMKKWKCKDCGEKNAFVIFQFASPVLFESIDIGNEGSAFIEIFVGKTGSDDYKLLLGACTLMSPTESKMASNNNRNRVKMFSKDKFCYETSIQKWDRVKIICSQPFNKLEQYGVSFLRFRGMQVENMNTNQEIKKPMFSFSFPASTYNSASLKPGDLFKKFQNKTTALDSTEEQKTSAAAAKDATKLLTSPAHKVPTVIKESPKPTPVVYNQPKTSVKKDTSTTNISSSKATNLKRKFAEIKEPRKTDEKIIFTLSGFKNPFRAELRDKAVKLGASYKPDWDSTCTHLICAFVNTPKYNEALGHGKIVDKKWIIDSFAQKKFISCEKYGMDTKSASKEPTTPSSTTKNTPPVAVPTVKKIDSPKVTKKTPEVIDLEILDTDEVEKNVIEESDDAFDADTDIEDSQSGLEQVKNSITDVHKVNYEELKAVACEVGVPVLPNFFDNHLFYLFGKFDAKERHDLFRFIVAFGGNLCDYMSSKITHVIASKENEKWSRDFEETLSLNPKLIFVKSQWIYDCQVSMKLDFLSAKYLISKSE